MPLFVYGIMLVLFIIFLPKGIAGACADQWLAFKSNRKLNT
jgi:ABC-type branched-subunit amino acid transport system permease subunit